jgi:hypothetical protein
MRRTGEAQKPVIITDYNQHVGYNDKRADWLIAIQLVEEQ